MSHRYDSPNGLITPVMLIQGKEIGSGVTQRDWIWGPALKLFSYMALDNWNVYSESWLSHIKHTLWNCSENSIDVRFYHYCIFRITWSFRPSKLIRSWDIIHGEHRATFYLWQTCGHCQCLPWWTKRREEEILLIMAWKGTSSNSAILVGAHHNRDYT